MKKRNVFIDLWRVVFALIVVCFHARDFYVKSPYFVAGHMAVEFFFILSGFLMNRSVKKEEQQLPIVSTKNLGDHTLRFICKKFKSIYPYFLFAFVVIFAEKAIFLKKSFSQIIHDFLFSIWELLFISEAGLSKPVYRINGPAWYLSALFIGMLIIYPIMRNRRRLFALVIAPLTAVFLLSYLMQTYKTIISAVWKYSLLSSFTLKRAIAEICVGIFIYELYEKMRKFDWTAFAKVIFIVLEFAGYFFAIASMYLKWNQNGSTLVVLVLALTVCLSFVNWDLSYQKLNIGKNTKLYDHISSLSLVIYVSHIAVMFFLQHYIDKLLKIMPYKAVFVIYIVSAVVFAEINLGIISLIKKAFAKMNVKKLFIKNSI